MRRFTNKQGIVSIISYAASTTSQTPPWDVSALHLLIESSSKHMENTWGQDAETYKAELKKAIFDNNLAIGKRKQRLNREGPTETLDHMKEEFATALKDAKTNAKKSKQPLRIQAFKHILNPEKTIQNYEEKDNEEERHQEPQHPLAAMLVRRSAPTRRLNLPTIAKKKHALSIVRKYPAGTSLRDILKVEAPMRRQVFTAEQIESSLAKAEGRAPRRLKVSPAELHPEYFGSEVIGKASVQEELQRRTSMMLSEPAPTTYAINFQVSPRSSVTYRACFANILSGDKLRFRAERAASKRKKPCNRSTELERRCYVPGLPEQSDLPSKVHNNWISNV